MTIQATTVLAAAAGLLLALSSMEVARAAEPCAWEARLSESTTVQGHRVAVIFSSFTDQSVQLKVADQPVLERTLTTTEWSAAYSGSVQCRLEGRTHFTVAIDGSTTSLYLNVDGPLQIYVSPATGGIDIALFETEMDGFLLD